VIDAGQSELVRLDTYRGLRYRDAPEFGEERHHEENVSTQQPQAQKDPWFPGTHAHPERPQGAPRAPPQGAQADCCLSAGANFQLGFGSNVGPIFKRCTGMASGQPGDMWWFFSCPLKLMPADLA
jgi:hypothetical protein